MLKNILSPQKDILNPLSSVDEDGGVAPTPDEYIVLEDTQGGYDLPVPDFSGLGITASPAERVQVASDYLGVFKSDGANDVDAQGKQSGLLSFSTADLSFYCYMKWSSKPTGAIGINPVHFWTFAYADISGTNTSGLSLGIWYITDTPYIIFRVDDNNGIAKLCGVDMTPYADDTLHHICGVLNPSSNQAILYVNGVAVSTQDITGWNGIDDTALQGSASPYQGAIVLNGSPITFTVSELDVFGRVLAPSETQGNFTGGNPTLEYLFERRIDPLPPDAPFIYLDDPRNNFDLYVPDLSALGVTAESATRTYGLGYNGVFNSSASNKGDGHGKQSGLDAIGSSSISIYARLKWSAKPSGSLPLGDVHMFCWFYADLAGAIAGSLGLTIDWNSGSMIPQIVFGANDGSISEDTRKDMSGLLDDTFYHITGVLDTTSEELRLYLNGALAVAPTDISGWGGVPDISGGTFPYQGILTAPATPVTFTFAKLAYFKRVLAIGETTGNFTGGDPRFEYDFELQT